MTAVTGRLVIVPQSFQEKRCEEEQLVKQVALAACKTEGVPMSGSEGCSPQVSAGGRCWLVLKHL